MDEDGHLLMILHQPPRPEDNEVRQAAVFWLNAAGEWKSAPTGGGFSALQAHVEEYRARVRELDSAVDAARMPREYFDVMRAINPLLRSARNLLAVTEEARKARPSERRLIVLRDAAVEVERGADLLANDARAGMEFSLAESGEQQAQSARQSNDEARRLNRMVAFFFPLATLVAFFGMSDPAEVLQMPGVWLVVIVGILLGLGVRMMLGGRREG